MSDPWTGSVRETLRRHAGTITPDGTDAAAARLRAVRQRVETSRRRRQAALTGGVLTVVLAVAGVAAGGVLLGRSHPTVAGPDTGRTVLGRQLPTTMKVLGATYRLESVRTGHDGRLSVKDLARDPSAPALVRVVSRTAVGRLEVTTTLPGRTWSFAAGAPEGYVYAPAQAASVGRTSSLSLAQTGTASPGDVAVVVYRLQTMPKGVTAGGLTYPRVNADRRLLGAAVAPNKRLAAIGTLHDSTGWGFLTVHCIATTLLTDHAQVEVSSGGRLLYRGTCDENGPMTHVDGSTSPTGTISLAPATMAHLGSSLTVRLVAASGTTMGPLEQSLVGAAVYTDPDAGSDDPRHVQVDGHLWTLVGRGTVVGTGTAPDYVTAGVPGKGRILVNYTLIPSSPGRMEIGPADQPGGASTIGFDDPGEQVGGSVPLPDATQRLFLRFHGTGRPEVRLTFYEVQQ